MKRDGYNKWDFYKEIFIEVPIYFQLNLMYKIRKTSRLTQRYRY